jgi:hypothetical protein
MLPIFKYTLAYNVSLPSIIFLSINQEVAKIWSKPRSKGLMIKFELKSKKTHIVHYITLLKQ